MGMSTNLKCSAVLSILGIGLFSAPSAHAQDNYPWKPIQLVVTTAAGGALDLVARTVADGLSAAMHQPIIIDNQPAGNGSVAARKAFMMLPPETELMVSRWCNIPSSFNRRNAPK